MDVT